MVYIQLLQAAAIYFHFKHLLQSSTPSTQFPATGSAFLLLTGKLSVLIISTKNARYSGPGYHMLGMRKM